MDAFLKSVARSYGVLRFTEQARVRMNAAASIALDPVRASDLGVLDSGADLARLFTCRVDDPSSAISYAP